MCDLHADGGKNLLFYYTSEWKYRKVELKGVILSFVEFDTA